MNWIEPRVEFDKSPIWQKPTLGEIYEFFVEIQDGQLNGEWMLKEIQRNGL